MHSVAPIPTDWCDAVIKILKRSDPKECRWTLRARQDWQLIGITPQAYTLLIETLKQRIVWGEHIQGMLPLPNPPQGEQQTVYAFLCEHPLNLNLPIYAKIGLFDGHLCLDIFSLHNDYTNELIKKIAAAKKQLKAAQKKARKHGN